MKMGEQVGRKRLLKRFWFVPIVVFASGMMGPLLFSLTTLFSGNVFVLEVCEVTPNPHPYSISMMAAFDVWSVMFLPIYLGQIVNAIYVKLTLWLGTMVMLSFFLLMAIFSVQCWMLMPIATFIFYALVMSLLSACLVIWFIRERIQKTIRMNSHAFDFDTMRWAITAPLMHVNGKVDSSQILSIALVASIAGMIVGKLAMGSWFSLDEVVNRWVFAIFIWTIGWVTMFVFGGGELYVIWLIWKRSRREGKSMLTAELVKDI